MLSTPVMACSSGEATVSPITLGLAPGNSARTTTVGGTTSGYSLIGSWNSEMAPPMRITSDSTAAKIGRLTKNCEKFMTHSGGEGAHHAPWRNLLLCGAARLLAQRRTQVLGGCGMLRSTTCGLSAALIARCCSCSAARVSASAIGTLCGSTALPGRMRCKPLTTMVSPSPRSEEHTSELQSRENLVCRLLLET